MYKMRNRELNGYFTVLVLWGVTIFGKAEIYVVALEGEPVVSCRGGADGFKATTMDSDSDDKIDVTRFETWYQIGLDHQGRVGVTVTVIQVDKAALREGFAFRKAECAFCLDLAIHSLRITDCSMLSR